MIRRIAVPVIPLLLMAAAAAAADDLVRSTLFQIDRSANSKVVKYDLQLEADGTLHRKQPVVAYWYRPDDADEPTRKLSWIQRRFAYGFKTEVDDSSGAVRLDMVADLGRPIVVMPLDGDYRATIRIDGADCTLEELFIASTGSGMGTKVQYIDLRGRDLATGAERYERITP